MNKVVLEINGKRHITKPYSVCSKCSIRKLCNQEGITHCLGYVLTKGDVCHFEVEKELNALSLTGELDKFKANKSEMQASKANTRLYTKD